MTDTHQGDDMAEGLIEKAEGKPAGMTLAAKNIRLLLKRHYPNDKFSVRCEKAPWASSIAIGYVQYPESPSTSEIDALCKRFVSGKHDSEQEGWVGFTDPQGIAFRTRFGSTPRMHCQALPASTEEIAQRHAHCLEKASPVAPTKPRQRF